MKDNTHTFTLKVKGLPLTNEHKAAISDALNNTLMEHIGQMDFRGLAGEAADVAATNKFVGQVIGIDGGRLERIIKQGDFLKATLELPRLDNFQVRTKQLMR